MSTFKLDFRYTLLAMNYRQTLDYLYQQLPMYQRVGNMAFKKDLVNITRLCNGLDKPQEQFKSIHIAGTNGKGSVGHILSAVLQAQGLKVGLYTSPHYRDFRERIKINGEYVSEEYVTRFVAANKESWKPIVPSFFEITVAMAFRYFADQEVDIAIIETGLGGRLDSTNVLTPLISVITNISFDHQDMLGNTLGEIAVEKAGIIKPNIPVVIGESNAISKPIFRGVAAKNKSTLYFADKLHKAVPISVNHERTVFNVFHHKVLRYPALKVNMTGEYQFKNLQTALQVIDLLPFYIQEDVLRNGLLDLQERTNYLGRWKVLSEEPLTICDSAHNEAGLRYAMRQLKHTPHRNLHIILGMVKEKDLSKILTVFPKDAHYYFAKANVPRGLSAHRLKEQAAEHGLKGVACYSIENALEQANANAYEDDLIFVGGSIFTVAEVI